MLATDQLTFTVDNKRIVDSLSLNFSDQTLHGIIGPNGSGKTTLLKLLTRISKPSKGKVLYNGYDLAEKKPLEISQLIAYVPQTFNSCFDYLVEDIVGMGSYCHKGLSKELKESRLISALKFVDALPLRHRWMQTLSGGERQRIYIARALMADAPILLLDEPTSSLDIGHQLEIWQLLLALRSSKLIITTVHDLHFAEQFCDQLYLLKSGSCIAQGKIENPPLQMQVNETFGIKPNPQENLRAYQLIEV